MKEKVGKPYLGSSMGCLRLDILEKELPTLKVVHGDRKVAQRWLSLDPLAADYASWSPYNYVLGNPISLIDPDGREPWEPIGNGQWKAEEGDSAWSLSKHAKQSPGEADFIVQSQLGKNYKGDDGQMKSDVEVGDVVQVSEAFVFGNNDLDAEADIISSEIEKETSVVNELQEDIDSIQRNIDIRVKSDLSPSSSIDGKDNSEFFYKAAISVLVTQDVYRKRDVERRKDSVLQVIDNLRIIKKVPLQLEQPR